MGQWAMLRSMLIRTTWPALVGVLLSLPADLQHDLSLVLVTVLYSICSVNGPTRGWCAQHRCVMAHENSNAVLCQCFLYHVSDLLLLSVECSL